MPSILISTVLFCTVKVSIWCHSYLFTVYFFSFHFHLQSNPHLIYLLLRNPLINQLRLLWAAPRAQHHRVAYQGGWTFRGSCGIRYKISIQDWLDRWEHAVYVALHLMSLSYLLQRVNWLYYSLFCEHFLIISSRWNCVLGAYVCKIWKYDSKYKRNKLKSQSLRPFLAGLLNNIPPLPRTGRSPVFQRHYESERFRWSPKRPFCVRSCARRAAVWMPMACWTHWCGWKHVAENRAPAIVVFCLIYVCILI